MWLAFGCKNSSVVVVHGTKKFLDRVRSPLSELRVQSTTALGAWYTTVLFWKPQVALFVNESTLLPVLMPLAPAVTVLDRFPLDVATIFEVHGVSRAFVAHEVGEMAERRVPKTNNRSVVGIMNEFAYLASVYRDAGDGLVELSVRLAATPMRAAVRQECEP